MRGDGTNLRRLTNNDVPDLRPVWSPNGAQLAFVEQPRQDLYQTEQDLMVVASDGANLRKLSSDHSSKHGLVWSPDGTQLAYTATLGTDSTVHLFRVENATDHVFAAGSDPSWSPDGARVAFASGGSLIVIGADGSGRKTPFQGTAGIEVRSPTWAPDGRSLVFVRATSQTASLEMIKAKGSRPVSLSAWPIGATGTDSLPAYSPNGRSVAFVRHERRARSVGRLAIVAATGHGGVRILKTANLGWPETPPQWRPRS
jgi:Tol biopolymer transport system component